MAPAALRKLRFGKPSSLAGLHLGGVAGPELEEQRLIAPEKTRLQEAGRDGDVLSRLPQTVVDTAGRMADLEAQIPEEVEDRLDHLLAARRRLVGQQEQQVDVAVGRQFTTAVTAGRDDGKPFGHGGVGQGIEILPHVIVDQTQHLIGLPRQQGGCGTA